MEQKLQFFKIPNKLILEYNDSEIFTFIIISYEAKYGKCMLSQEHMAEKHGNTQKFYSNAINNLKEFITVQKTYQTGGKKENNVYIIKEITEDFTIIYAKTIERLQENYKNLTYYCKIKRWINKDTNYMKNMTKQEIANTCHVSKNTSNSYLKELNELNIITIENSKELNKFNIKMIHELKLIEINNKIDEWNKENEKNV